jgi:hypothetical protein
MPPPFQWIHKRQSNEAQTNPPNQVRHLSMAEWATRSRTQEILKKEGTYYDQAYQAKDESRATGKSRHHVNDRWAL